MRGVMKEELRAILVTESEELLGVANRLRQLRIAGEPNIQLCIAEINDARAWLGREVRRLM